jgi:hypothetical protein
MRIRQHAYIPTQPEVSSMAIRQSIANQLAAASKAVANDKSKEKLQASITIGRRKLADWIRPDECIAQVSIQVRPMLNAMVR